MGIESKFKNPLVGIIGGTGRMGSWFAEICQKSGYKVFKVGRKTEVTIEDVARKCDVVVVSVPISVTCEIIKRVGSLISKDALFIDLTSIKKMPMDTMLNFSKAEVVGLHPLFGADIDHSQTKKVVVCHGRGEEGKRWVVKLLKDAGFELVFLTPEKHDMIMGIVQGINHFETICLATRIKESGIGWKEIEHASTQTFMKKLIRMKNMFSQEPELFASLLMENDWSIKFIDLYIKGAKKFFEMIVKKDKERFKELFFSIRKFIEGGLKDEGDMGQG